MAILGIETLIYGVEDVKTSTRFFEDFGLPLVTTNATESRFQLPEGSSVVIRSLEDPTLPRSSVEGAGVLEVIWGMDSAQSLEALASKLGIDRELRRDEDGTVHFLTDFGIAMGLR